MHVLFVGERDDGISVSSHHARALAASGVQTSFDPPVDSEPASPAANSRPDIIHLVTFEQRDNALLRRLVAARMSGIQIVRYWTGRDLIWARHHQSSREFAQAIVRMGGAIQLCRSPEIAQGLGELGFKAAALPIISANISSAAPPQALPATFTVLCYLPSGRRAFHGGALVDALVDRLPSVRFLVLGGAQDALAGSPNVELQPEYTDCVRAIHRATVIIDPRVDCALSRLQLEALCHGRHAISGCALPHSHKASTVDEYIEAIRFLRENRSYNLEGRSFVARDHERHAASRALRKELEDALEPGRLNLVLEGGVRGAAAAMQNLHILGHRDFPMPDPDQLPAAALPLRCLLHDFQSFPQVATV